jgi:3-deoxy-D-arabino-heptulosonate 7-phosphate (DAHP) synthase
LAREHAALVQPAQVDPAAAVALAVVATTLSIRVPHASDENVPDTVAQLDPQDYEVVADLDDLIAMEEDGLWDDDTSTL